MAALSRVVFVYGTKGGVGKSTIAVNLAYALHMRGRSVGLVDLDLSGPNVPDLISGIDGRLPTMDGFRIVPGSFGGVDVVSIGFFVEPHEAPFIAGKYLEGALEQILFTNHWDQDFVVIDLPPGFHELHRMVLTRLAGEVVLITTPHVLSHQDLGRGVRFLERLGTPICGLIENMSHVHCRLCGRDSPLFERSDLELPVRLIAQVPFVSDPRQPDGRSVPLVLLDDERVARFRASILQAIDAIVDASSP